MTTRIEGRSAGRSSARRCRQREVGQAAVSSQPGPFREHLGVGVDADGLLEVRCQEQGQGSWTATDVKEPARPVEVEGPYEFGRQFVRIGHSADAVVSRASGVQGGIPPPSGTARSEESGSEVTPISIVTEINAGGGHRERRLDPVLQDGSHVHQGGSEQPLHLESIHQGDHFDGERTRVDARRDEAAIPGPLESLLQAPPRWSRSDGRSSRGPGGSDRRPQPRARRRG